MQLSPGSSLPTEEELQRQFGLSRGVVRQALSGLADLGLIRRQRGRGSVVAATPVLRRHVQRVVWMSRPPHTASACELTSLGLEWFNVWHSPNTVFDLDAQVTTQPARVSQEHIRRLRNLSQQLESELADFNEARAKNRPSSAANFWHWCRRLQKPTSARGH
ncbi:GntR family transcriptional regulator [Arthrobacter sp. SLBN-100]|uniref:GntR family transcriptional regulator n=1 Tax=Arthrobacter sp. SLBN-100 TaxID=2768450 RepID=UPI001F3E8541|nr:GntR family transcriptional regulator [Arthrobacter sp. SLBN-100]